MELSVASSNSLTIEVTYAYNIFRIKGRKYTSLGIIIYRRLFRCSRHSEKNIIKDTLRNIDNLTSKRALIRNTTFTL